MDPTSVDVWPSHGPTSGGQCAFIHPMSAAEWPYGEPTRADRFSYTLLALIQPTRYRAADGHPCWSTRGVCATRVLRRRAPRTQHRVTDGHPATQPSVAGWAFIYSGASADIGPWILLLNFPYSVSYVNLSIGQPIYGLVFCGV